MHSVYHMREALRFQCLHISAQRRVSELKIKLAASRNVSYNTESAENVSKQKKAGFHVGT
jgi:hypothetical protein